MHKVFKLTKRTCVRGVSGSVCYDQCSNLAGRSIPLCVKQKLHFFDECNFDLMAFIHKMILFCIYVIF